MVKWVTVILALVGVGMGVYTVMSSRMTPPALPLAGRPSLNPYQHGIAASGKVEAAGRQVAVAAPEPGRVEDVLVQVNQRVARGEPLFRIDSRLVEAERVVAQASLALARAEVQRLEGLPRAEDVKPLDAALARAKVQLESARDEHARTEQAFKQGAATPAEMQRRVFARQGAEAALAEAQAIRDRVAAGAWEKDLIVARANLARAQAAIGALDIRLDHLIARSPTDGVVLKRNIEPGEFAQPGLASAAVIVGDLSTLHIRAQVDEEDAPRLRPGLTSVASLRGATRTEIPLRMIHIEPLAVPKRDLTGSIVEVVDTRVVEVLYEVTPGPRPELYPGQIVDVFIDAPAAASQPGPAASQPEAAANLANR